MNNGKRVAQLSKIKNDQIDNGKALRPSLKIRNAKPWISQHSGTFLSWTCNYCTL